MPASPTIGQLRIRKLADKSEGQRIFRWDPDTGEKTMINPATGQPEAWPLAGIQFKGDPPAACRVSTTKVVEGVSEGWIELDNHDPEVVPAGPVDDPWKPGSPIPHVFHKADAITFKTVDGDVRYSVTHQPGKYDDPDEPSGTRIDWFYDLTLEA